eukprot:5620823-Amphidinium_carterae.1
MSSHPFHPTPSQKCTDLYSCACCFPLSRARSILQTGYCFESRSSGNQSKFSKKGKQEPRLSICCRGHR